MAGKEKTYVWIGDDGDNKSILIDRKVYASGSEIPADKVDNDTLEEWEDTGLVSVDGKTVKVVTVDGAELEGRIAELEADNAKLKKDLDKANKGKKAEALKALEADIEEKAALIEKHAERITELEAEVEALTDPDADSGGNDDSGGPQ